MNCPVCNTKLESQTLDIGTGVGVKREDIVIWELTIPQKGTVRVCGSCFLLTNILDELKKINLQLKETQECAHQSVT